MKFKVMSDLHGSIEFLPDTEQKDTVLLLPGDIHETAKKNQYKEIVQKCCNVFKEVVLICGNHEFYGKNIISSSNFLEQLSTEIENFTFLSDSSTVIGDVGIVGSTLWTDFDNNNPLVKYDAKMFMNDYRYIRCGDRITPWKRPLSTDIVYTMHLDSKKIIKDELDKLSQMGYTKRIVMSHHAPSWQSVHSSYANDKMNGCFVSDLDDFIITNSPDVWVHGHVHNSFDYYINKTRIICNPHGYTSKYSNETENKSFNPDMAFEL